MASSSSTKGFSPRPPKTQQRATRQQEDAAATNIQRIWRGHHGKEIAQHKAAERKRKLREHIEQANLLEAVLVIQTRIRMYRARCRKNRALRERKETVAAAVNIQRTWRGHHGREAVLQRMDERRTRLRHHLEKANLLEAVLVIQTRVRIFLARIRRRALSPQSFQKRRPATPQPFIPTRPYTGEDAAAVTNIQRVWRGHRGREVVHARAAERERKLREHIEQANMLEAVLMIQTRVRIYLARIRRRIREDLLKNRCISPNHRIGEVDDAACNIQRVWRGHHGREAALRRMAVRKRRLDAHLDKANLLEAVLVIQTRVRIFLARTRLRMRLSLKDKIAPGHRVGEAEGAVTNIQRTWRGRHDRELVQQLAADRNRKRREYVERANLLEAAIVIQTRVRIYLAQVRRGIKARRADLRSQQSGRSTLSSAAGGPRPLFPGGRAAYCGGSANSARPPHSKVGADRNASASALRYSLTGRPGSAAARWPQQQQQQQLGQLPPHERQMYSMPAVPRSGFFVRSMEEAVMQQNVAVPYRSPPRGRSSQSPHRQRSASPPSSATAAISFSPDTASKVLSTPESIATYVTKLIAVEHRSVPDPKSSRISKHAALGALIEIFGGGKAAVIISTWENVTPFGECQSLSSEQLGLILMQLRTLRMLAEQ